MLHIHLDMLGGLAGDMFVAGAIDAGLFSVDALEGALSGLGLGRIRVNRERVRRRGLMAMHVSFEGWAPEQERDHRHLSEILEMLEHSTLEEGVRRRAAAMFNALGVAEAAVHGVTLEEVHFHEVGAIDSILDFVSAAWILEHVEATWSAGPVPSGHGTISTDHGILPVPAPATARLLEGFRMVQRDVDGEMVTPTGAAILRHIAPGQAPPPAILARSGYGAGTAELEGLANVVRFVVYEVQGPAERQSHDRVVRLQCEIDDMSAEALAHVEGLLFEAGALDVCRVPVQMKKGRLGTMLSVLCSPDRREPLSELVLRETSTFGLRVDYVDRVKLARRLEEVDTPFGRVRVKIGYWGDEIIKVSPEYEDCAEKARTHRVGLQDVYQAARAAASEVG